MIKNIASLTNLLACMSGLTIRAFGQWPVDCGPGSFNGPAFFMNNRPSGSTSSPHSFKGALNGFEGATAKHDMKIRYTLKNRFVSN